MSDWIKAILMAVLISGIGTIWAIDHYYLAKRNQSQTAKITNQETKIASLEAEKADLVKQVNMANELADSLARDLARVPPGRYTIHLNVWDPPSMELPNNPNAMHGRNGERYSPP